MTQRDELEEYIENLEGVVMDTDDVPGMAKLYIKFIHPDSDIKTELKKGVYDRAEELDGVDITSWDKLEAEDFWEIKTK